MTSDGRASDARIWARASATPSTDELHMPGELSHLEQIFTDALSRITAADRAVFLDHACAGDTDLRRRVEALLRAHDDAAAAMLPLPTLEHAAEPDPAEGPGQSIGPYRLLAVIGEGGFGTVYLAEQEHPVRRRVALKVIKLGMDTRQVIARFEAERQALAMMDHAHVAKVFDAGATDAGQPYFVMELVTGPPITDYCDQHKLPIPRRLELFVQVCQAVQHAHQKGLIHRDLKPTNVLVSTQDDRPHAKVIDFGIAKATQARLTERTMFTEFQQLIGTPQYMSPEQAESSLDIDTRSDVYALGVLLYELLTGTTPFDARELRSMAYAEMQRVIREVEPPWPSTRLSTMRDVIGTVAARRAIQPRGLDSLVRGELDWIVMKAMEKDRRRRYDSAAALAADVTNYLSDEPVAAAAPSRVYRARKFVRRNRGPVIASALVLVVLIAGVVGTTLGLIGQSRQRAIAEVHRDHAERAREQAEAVTNFLTETVFRGAQPDRLPDKSVRDQIVRAMIDPAAASAEQRFKDQPLLESPVRSALSLAYSSVGRSDLAQPHAERVLQICRQLHGNDDPETLTAATDLAVLLENQGKLDEAEALAREAVQGRRRISGDDDPQTLTAINNLAHILQSRGKFDEAERLFREGVERSRRTLGNEHEHTLTAIDNLAALLSDRGKYDESEPLVREALAARRRTLGDSDLVTLQSVNNFGMQLLDAGKFAQAEPLLREALGGFRRVLGEDHPTTLVAINNLTCVLQPTGRNAEAEPLCREVLARRRRLLGDDHPDTLYSINNLAFVLRELGRFGECETLMREGMERSRRVLGENHPTTMDFSNNMAGLLIARHKYAEAEALLRENLERCRRVLGEGHPDTLAAMHNIGAVLLFQGKPDQAEPFSRKALDGRRRVLGDDHPLTITSLEATAHAVQKQGRHADAEPLLREVRDAHLRTLGKDRYEVGRARAELADTLVALRHYPEAEVELVEAQRVLSLARGGPADAPKDCIASLVALYRAWDAAEPGHGHDAQGRRWQAQLPTTQAAPTSRSATPAPSPATAPSA